MGDLAVVAAGNRRVVDEDIKVAVGFEIDLNDVFIEEIDMERRPAPVVSPAYAQVQLVARENCEVFCERLHPDCLWASGLIPEPERGRTGVARIGGGWFVGSGHQGFDRQRWHRMAYGRRLAARKRAG